jgi:hypothetical protein
MPLVLLMLLLMGCARPPAVAPDDPPIDEAPSVVRPGTAGAVVVLARNLVKKRTREVAADLLEAAVSQCDPPLDVVVVLEPGIAAVWTGFPKRAELELRRHREMRKRCLEGRRAPEVDVEEQVALVMDDRGDLRRDLLEQDPGSDIVVLAYNARGQRVYAAGIKENPEEALRAARSAIGRR